MKEYLFIASKNDLCLDDNILNMIPAANYLPAVDVRDGFLLFWLDNDNLFNCSNPSL